LHWRAVGVHHSSSMKASGGEISQRCTNPHCMIVHACPAFEFQGEPEQKRSMQLLICQEYTYILAHSLVCRIVDAGRRGAQTPMVSVVAPKPPKRLLVFPSPCRTGGRTKGTRKLFTCRSSQQVALVLAKPAQCDERDIFWPRGVRDIFWPRLGTIGLLDSSVESYTIRRRF
jgi:hypothetical protein